jgi:GNAT superfamily N-acetyltransferase
MLTFQVDSFASSIPELERIFPEHHKELGLLRGLMPLAPDYVEYVRREIEGRLFLVTGRWDGRIACYYVAQVAPGFHYKTTLTGHMDICYVLPEFRDRGLALPLFRAVERELRRRGVQAWYSGHKTLNPMGMDRLHELMGFESADTYRLKWLGGPR